MHRESAKVGGTYTVRSLHRDFASENDALMLDNTIPSEKNAESPGHSVILPVPGLVLALGHVLAMRD
jgi:hypothetical protein